MNSRSITVFVIALVASISGAQGWSSAYESALASIADADWAAARTSFQQAVVLRPEDQSKSTSLPGPVTEPRQWRQGAPYSPNFGAAYCLYRTALNQQGNEKTASLKTAAREFEIILAKGQQSAPTYFFLNQVYSINRDVARMDALSVQLDSSVGGLAWKVDRTILAPEENAAINAAMPTAAGAPPAGSGPKTTVIKAGDLVDGKPPMTNIGAPAIINPTTSLAGRVPTIHTKFALIIGNSESMMEDHRLAFGASDAMLIREALVEHAGYEEMNVDIVANATADQIRASAQALAERMPIDATLMLYFTGAGFNIAGRDYYAGIDAESPQDSAHMVAVGDIYKMFLAKGTSIFAFSQAHRPITSGLYFGKEAPLFGRISQAHATIPGQDVYSLASGGQMVGSYSKAIADILADFRSNQVPIMEFVWQVFYQMRQGGGPQTPTLPVLTVMSADSRF